MMMGSRNTHLIGWLQHCWGILVESGRFSIIRKQSSKHCPADRAVILALGHFISERAGGVQSMQLSLSLGSCLLTGPAREIRWWTRWWINFGADQWPGQLNVAAMAAVAARIEATAWQQSASVSQWMKCGQCWSPMLETREHAANDTENPKAALGLECTALAWRGQRAACPSFRRSQLSRSVRLPLSSGIAALDMIHAHDSFKNHENNVCGCVDVCSNINVYIYIFIYIYVWLDKHTHTCTYIYIYLHIHKFHTIRNI
jgi:hypothetical protein